MKVLSIEYLFWIFPELLQIWDQQGGDVYPLHSQTVWYAPSGWELHRYSINWPHILSDKLMFRLKGGCLMTVLLLSLSTEAAFTLLLYWELLHWDERPLKEFLHYPAQTEWHRKEGLCRKVIHYFNKGKVQTGPSRQLLQLMWRGEE